MRSIKTLALWLVLGTACSGKTEPTHEAAKSHGRFEMVYDIDLDKVLDDRLSQIRGELAEQKISATVTTTRTLTAIASAPERRVEVAAHVNDEYGSAIEPRDCEPDAPPAAVCFGLSVQQSRAIEQAALESTVKTLRERIDVMKLDAASVVPRGKQIVVELVGGDAATLESVRALISRAGRLELRVVDEDSPFMKRVFAHVDGDPAALAAGIRAEIDRWENHTDDYLTAPDRPALERYFADLAKSDPSFVVPDDRTLGFELTEPTKPGDKPRWRSYYLKRFTLLLGAMIADAESAHDPNTGRPIVTVKLATKGAALFGELTARIVGKKLATILDGRIVTAPIISGAIRGGLASIALAGGDPATQQKAADVLATILKSGALPAPLAEVSARVVRE